MGWWGTGGNPMTSLGVIFDVDGTIVDNHVHHEEAWLVWGERNRVDIDRAFYREHLYARSNERILRTLFGERLDAGRLLAMAMEKEAIYRELYAPEMQPMAGLVDLLVDLERAGIPCAAASNANRVNVDFVVDGLALRGFFRAVLAIEDVERGKPEPDLVLLAARRMGLPPARCLVFEDSPAGFEAARRAGAPFFAIAGHGRGGAIPPDAVGQAPDFTTLTAAALEAFL